MYISRNLVAKLLETKPNNIKSLKQVEENIYIKLGDSSDELFMTLKEYQNCLQQLKHHKGQINCLNFITIAIIFATLIFMSISSANTKLANDDSDHTVGLESQ